MERQQKETDSLRCKRDGQLNRLLRFFDPFFLWASVTGHECYKWINSLGRDNIVGCSPYLHISHAECVYRIGVESIKNQRVGPADYAGQFIGMEISAFS